MQYASASYQKQLQNDVFKFKVTPGLSKEIVLKVMAN